MNLSLYYMAEPARNHAGLGILEAIGRKRGFLMRGGEIDYNRSAVIVADEFRGGKLGRMTLELPE